MEIKQELTKIVGAQYMLDDLESLELYSRDYSLTPPRKPAYVVRPGNTGEIQELVRLANESLMPLVPCSSGVHFHGGTLPDQGGIIVDLRRMNRILEIDEQNMYALVEPYVSFSQLQGEAMKKGCIRWGPDVALRYRYWPTTQGRGWGR